jgi:hypothetical protein
MEFGRERMREREGRERGIKGRFNRDTDRGE